MISIQTKAGFDEVRWSDLAYFQIWMIVSPPQKETNMELFDDFVEEDKLSSNLHFQVFNGKLCVDTSDASGTINHCK